MLIASRYPAMHRNALTHMDRSLERFLGHALADKRPTAPQFQEDAEGYRLSLDLPGIGRDQLSITIDAAVVRIHSREGAARQYRVAYEMPQDIDASSSEAKLKHGVLQLKLAKKIPPSQATEITIQ